ncbi:Hsp20 family protein, partial [Vibrio parahaemolyticus]|nr:Hsp20 family protein [Vibrio parahaemolyticus]
DRLMGFVTGGDITADVPLLTTGTSGERALGRQGTGAGQLTQWNPRMDVRETDNNLILHAELPGCNRDDIKLSIDNNRLVLEGQKSTHKKE